MEVPGQGNCTCVTDVVSRDKVKKKKSVGVFL